MPSTPGPGTSPCGWTFYLPEGQGAHPLIVWIHGGAFRSGDKGGIFWSPMPRQTERGYAVASINYRLSGQAARLGAVTAG